LIGKARRRPWRFEIRNIVNNKGFTLFELVVTIILIGIIGVLSSLFLYNGIRGYMTSKLASEGALTGQIAMDRIALELRSIQTIDSFDDTGGNVVMDYKSSSLPGARELRYDSANQQILIGVGEQHYLLLDRVPTFSLSIDRANLDNRTGDEVAGFEVSFTIADIGKPFATRIYPRTFLTAP
jgi:prepilin-type N-terminal cleavage/methylation domain-containing protein